MDTQLLVSFAELARQRHFGRSAMRLGMSQSALSQRIRRLEDHVGTPLFERTSRSVELTAAGRSLVPDARRLLMELERAISHARKAGLDQTDRVALGSIGAGLNSLTPLLVRALRERTHGAVIRVVQMDTPEGLDALRGGEVDVAVVRFAGEPTGVLMETLLVEPLMAALPRTHRLARRPSVAIADLRHEEFVLWPRARNPWLRDQVVAACRTHLFEPRVTMEAPDAETLLGLISADLGVSLLPSTFSSLKRDGVVWRSLTGDAPRSAIQVAWCERTPGPLVPMVVDAAREAAAAWVRA